MTSPSREAENPRPGLQVRPRRPWDWNGLAQLWPQWPLALVLALVGILNILDGLRLPLRALEGIQAFSGLAESLSALGSTAQVILGLMLVVAGIGLLWRLISAWTLAVSLLVVTVAVNAVRGDWGVSLALQSVLLGTLLWTRSQFTHRTVLASLLLSFSGILAVLAYGVLGSLLIGAGFRPEIRDLSTAFYFTIVTLSTVGYGDIVPITPEARWFAISLLIIGLGVFASAIASAVGPKISGELNRLFNPDKKPMELKDHVILIGEGVMARNTAEELTRRNVRFVQIVAETGGADTAKPANEIIAGEAMNDGILQQAGIVHARLVIAAGEDDGQNAIISLVAKDLNPGVRVLAVANAQSSMRRLRLAKADLVFSPAAVGSRLLADLVEGGSISPAFADLLDGFSAD